MADSKISALDAAAALGGSEAIPAVQGGGNVRLTPAQLMTYILGGAAGVEMVQDIVGGLIAPGGGIATTYNDAGNALTVALAVKANVAASDPLASSDAGAGYAAGSSWLNIATGVRWACLDATTGAAVWTAAGGMTHPGYVSGRTYGAQRGQTSGSFTASADTLYAIPIHVAQRVTIASLCLYIGTAATGNVRLGVYANAGGAPAAKLAELAAPASTGTVGGVQAALAANLTLAPGVYWLAALYSAAPTGTGIGSTDQFVSALIGGTSLAGVLGQGSQVTGHTGVATYAGGLPASFGAATIRAGVSPLIGFTVA